MKSDSIRKSERGIMFSTAKNGSRYTSPKKFCRPESAAIYIHPPPPTLNVFHAFLAIFSQKT